MYLPTRQPAKEAKHHLREEQTKFCQYQCEQPTLNQVLTPTPHISHIIHAYIEGPSKQMPSEEFRLQSSLYISTSPSSTPCTRSKPLNHKYQTYKPAHTYTNLLGGRGGAEGSLPLATHDMHPRCGIPSVALGAVLVLEFGCLESRKRGTALKQEELRRDCGIKKVKSEACTFLVVCLFIQRRSRVLMVCLPTLLSPLPVVAHVVVTHDLARCLLTCPIKQAETRW